MSRVRASILAFAVMSVLVACKTKAGDKCAKGQVLCGDPAGALFCGADSKLATIGPQGPATTKGVRILVGQTKTIEVDLFSDAPMGDWTAWNAVFHYPSENGPEPEPPPHELLAALDILAKVQTEIVALGPLV